MSELQGYRLSPQQRRLWRLARNCHRPTQCAALVDAGIATEALRQAIEQAALEHEILRTVYQTVAGIKYPLQVIHPALAPDIEMSAVGGEPIVGKKSISLPSLASPGQWDPARGPVLRAKIDASETGEHLVYLSTPSYCLDLWSLILLLRRVVGLGRGTVMPNDIVQYVDYSEWINQFIGAKESEPGKSYWRRSWDPNGIARGLPLAAAPSSCVQQVSDVLAVDLDDRIAASIDRTAHECGCSRSSLLLAAWGLLVTRHAEAANLTFAVAHVGRTHADFANALGPFGYCLPVSISPRTADNFCELVRQTECRRAEAEGWQECFDWPDPTQPPMFDASFEELPSVGEVQRDGYRVVGHSYHPERAPLHLAVSSAAEPTAGEIVYDARRYSAQAAAAFAEQFCSIVAAATRDSHAPLASVPVSSSCRAPHPARVAAPPGATLLEAFDLQLRERPGHPFVIAGRHQLSYREIDERSRNLAGALCGEGVGPGTLIALAFDRVPDMIIAVWAVLRAGAAYVPIDASYPPERIKYLIAKSGARLMLGDAPAAGRLPDCPVKVIDDLVGSATTRIAVGDYPAVCAESLAYVIFTSGSTGTPKGVEVTHASLLASTFARRAVYPGTVDRLLLLASFGFDSSAAGIFWTLLDGGTLFLSSHDAARDSNQIAKLIEQHRITHIQVLPSLYHALLQEDGQLHSLRAVTVAGEVCPPAVARLHYQRLPGTLLVNEYGPTESTIWSTAHICPEPDPDDPLPVRIPIGRSAGHVAIHVAETGQRLAPVGVPGEIMIGGPGLARGYLGEPGLTAVRFVPDPWSGIPGARMFRSGDRGFWQPDGTVEFLGRVDDQLKIRGFRVEPSEIESSLRELEGIQDACAVSRSDSGSARLHAFVRMHPGYKLERAAIRRRLQARLPDYMMPADFTVLREFPRNPNGKVNRSALRTMALEVKPADPSMAPQTAVQQTLVEIWSSILGMDRIGIHDNFFELGGDSIKILRVRSQARKRGLEFSVRQMLDCPTIAGLERAIAAAQPVCEPARRAFALVPEVDHLLLPADLEDAYPMTKLQLAMLYHTEQKPDSGIYHDVMTCHLRARFDADVFRRTLHEVVGRHAALRTSFDLANFSQPLQLVHLTASPLLQIIDWRERSAAEQERALAEFLYQDQRMHLDWSRPPLLRVTLHLRSDATWQISWTSHHAVLDGWSASSFAAEMIREYLWRTGETEIAPAAEPLPSFAEFVELEQAALASDETRDFWCKYLNPVSTSRMLTRRCDQEPFGPPVRRLIEIPVAASLRVILAKRAAQEGVPLKSVLMAAHVAAISRAGESQPPVTGVFTHGRPESEGADRTLGLFLNVLPLRIQMSGGTWRQLIRGIAEHEVTSFPHRRFPLAAIHEAIGCSQLFDTAFNYVNFHVVADAIRTPGIEILSTSSFGMNEFAWTTLARDNPEGVLALELHFDPARIEEDLATRIARALQANLDAMADDLDREIPQIESSFASPTMTAPARRTALHRAPTSPCERRLAELCRRVLATDRIGVDDDFFAVGGDSLKALRFVALASREFGRHLSLSAFLSSPSLADLARQIDGSEDADDGASPRCSSCANPTGG